MEDLPLVAVVQSPQQLEHEEVDIVRGQGTWVPLHVVTEVRVLGH